MAGIFGRLSGGGSMQPKGYVLSCPNCGAEYYSIFKPKATAPLCPSCSYRTTDLSTNSPIHELVIWMSTRKKDTKVTVGRESNVYSIIISQGGSKAALACTVVLEPLQPTKLTMPPFSFTKATIKIKDKRYAEDLKGFVENNKYTTIIIKIS
jgi:hypothetical protein